MNVKYIVNYFDNSKTHKQYITTKYNLNLKEINKINTDNKKFLNKINKYNLDNFKYSDYLLNKKHICNTFITIYFNIVMFTIIITFFTI